MQTFSKKSQQRPNLRENTKQHYLLLFTVKTIYNINKYQETKNKLLCFRIAQVDFCCSLTGDSRFNFMDLTGKLNINYLPNKMSKQ